jgi:threonine synthase
MVPKGSIALGKLSQAAIHGAKVLMVDGNFDQALSIARQISETHPVTLVNSVNPFRVEGQKTAAFEVVDQLGRAPTTTSSPWATAATSQPTGEATASTIAPGGFASRRAWWDSRPPAPTPSTKTA